MEIRRYAAPRPLPRRQAVVALTAKAKAPVARRPAGLSQLDAAKQACWPRFAGGAALSAGGLGMLAVGCLGVATLPYAAFAGLFAGGIAVIAAGLALAWSGAKGVADARAALDHAGLG